MAKGRYLAVLGLVALAAITRADVLMHKDGRRIEGTITSQVGDKIRIKTEFGELEFARADIVSIERGQTRQQEFAEKERLAKSADDFHRLGLWAREKGLAKEARRAMQRALDLDPKHAGAHEFFGRVPYKGEWLSPAERDQRAKADLEAEQKARGLVPFQDRWVTPEERAHLEKGDVLVDGKWLPFSEAQARKGLAEFEGRWLPRAEALARANAAAVEKLAQVRFEKHVSADALVCGPQPPEELARIGGLLDRGRAWFDVAFGAPRGLELFGGRLAEFYMFTEDPPYLATCAHFASLTKTVSPEWIEAVKGTHGFVWWDPYPLSSARRWHRDPADLPGHDLHHFGHLLLNRLGYDGRLLPPWFDEGVAAVLEQRSHGRNVVFCKGQKNPPPEGPSTGGPSSKGPDTKSSGTGARAPIAFDDKALHGGRWREALLAALPELPAFAHLAALQFDELEGVDIAAAMGIVEWLESRGDGALRRFLDVLRKHAPPAPLRVHPTGIEREIVYQEAFRSAAKMTIAEADQAWRAWIAKR